MSKKIIVFLADGFEEIEALSPVDYLRRAGAEVLTVSINDDEFVRGSHNIIVKTDLRLDSYLEKNDLPDAIIIPGGMPGSTNLANCTKLLNLVEKAFDKEKLICAICAAPAVVLGKTKLLKDKDWTCYPGMENHAESYLSSFNSEARLVKSGNLITAKGPGVAEEFSMEIVKTLFDDSLKEKIKAASIQR